MFCKVWFSGGEVYTKWFGTHAEYDKLTQADIDTICAGGPGAPGR